jgi:hypothetical protein
MTQVQTQNPLLGKFDRDAGRWRPYKYGVEIAVPVIAGGQESGAIQILNQPFVMDRISPSVVGDISDPVATGLADDGQYYIEWKDEQSEYQNQPLLAKTAFGTDQFPIPLSLPIAFAGNRTLTFRVTNAYTRVLNPSATTFRVFITIHGVADWGPDRQS